MALRAACGGVEIQDHTHRKWGSATRLFLKGLARGFVAKIRESRSIARRYGLDLINLKLRYRLDLSDMGNPCNSLKAHPAFY